MCFLLTVFPTFYNLSLNLFPTKFDDKNIKNHHEQKLNPGLKMVLKNLVLPKLYEN